MFTKRWSSFSLLCVALIAGLLFFLAGRLSAHDRLKSAGGKSVALRVDSQPKDFHATSAPVQPAASSETQGTQVDWRTLSTQPRTPATESDIAAYIEKLAETDPVRALSLAQAENNFRLRNTMLRATLQGWGRTAPDAAAAWVQSETALDRDQAVKALLTGAIQNPDKAASVTAALTENDPAHAAQYGSDLIWTLADAGQFAQAANFAASGAENNRSDWMLAAYSRWAEFQPQSAMASALQLQDPALKQSALDAVVVGWSPTDPKGMTEFALQNFPPEQQNAALSRALSFWADSDPAAAAEWINQNHLGAATDPGVAEIAMSPALAQSPDLAANWARTITDPVLRSRTLVSILQSWARLNLAAAKQYLDASSDIQGEDRSSLLAQMDTAQN